MAQSAIPFISTRASERSRERSPAEGESAALATRSPDAPAAPRLYSFEEAVFANIADDGGLFLPQRHPRIPADRARAAAERDFATLASFVAGYYDPQLARGASVYREIFPFAPRVRMLDDRLALLELYHGPTCAFKDFGAAFLSYTMERTLARATERVVILTATSGDTGSAVAHAFYNKKNIDVVVLYPARRVSGLQEAHINSFAHNIHSIRVRGTFDTCQALVKQAFADDSYRRSGGANGTGGGANGTGIGTGGDTGTGIASGTGTAPAHIAFSSANSINIGRLLPQSFYYHYAFHIVRAQVEGDIHFCVPSGNIGNLTAGVLAQKAGLPVASFIAATNSNRTVPLYLRRGAYRPRRTVRTISNAMDVGSPNNFERLLALYNGSHQQMRARLRGYWASERETRTAIRRCYDRYGIIVDPHTATALSAAHKARARPTATNAPPIAPNDVIVCLSTAHPAKFSHTVERATHQHIPLPPQLAHIATADATGKAPPPEQTIAPRYSALKDYLLERFGKTGALHLKANRQS